MRAPDGHGRIVFAVGDIEDVDVPRAHGAGLARREDSCRLCRVRGPEGIVVGPAEQAG